MPKDLARASVKFIVCYENTIEPSSPLHETIMAISGHKTASVSHGYNIVAPKRLQSAMQAVELTQRRVLEAEKSPEIEGVLAAPNDASLMQDRPLLPESSEAKC
jgi:hypothetical protein